MYPGIVWTSAPIGLFMTTLPCVSPQVSFQLQPARVYLEDTFVYYIKTLFHSYIPDSAVAPSSAGAQRTSTSTEAAPLVPEQVLLGVALPVPALHPGPSVIPDHAIHFLLFSSSPSFPVFFYLIS